MLIARIFKIQKVGEERENRNNKKLLKKHSHYKPQGARGNKSLPIPS